MKKIIFIFLFFSVQLYFSQRPGVGYETTTTRTKEETLNYNEISGSPFLTKDFVMGKAVCCNIAAPMRYDIYADEIQYKKDDVVYTLLKEEPYSKIVFTNPDTTVVLENINNVPGYYIQLVDGKSSLLKKVSIKLESLTDNKKTGFGLKDQASAFREGNPVYYLKTEKGTKELKGKKDVLDLYPDKANELNSFFDSNKIKFNKEESLIKLVNFLNTLK